MEMYESIIQPSSASRNDGTLVPFAPRKTQSKANPTMKTMREIRSTAAVYVQCFVSGCTGKTSEDDKWKRMEDQFYGNPDTRMVGCLRQIADGNSPFDVLYDKSVTDHGINQILKELVCGTDTRKYFATGEDFDKEILSLVYKDKPDSR